MAALLIMTACGPESSAPFGAAVSSPAAGSATPSTESATAGHRTSALTLAQADRACFYAPSPAGDWPFLRHTGIRGSFNEPRGPVHFGVDVAASTDEQAVHAIDSGTVVTARRYRFNVIDAPGHYFSYWHVHLEPGIGDGSRVWRGEVIGHVRTGLYHVHISEWARGCRFVDPRRPTGVFHDSRNIERPTIGPLTAYAANTSAWQLPDQPVRLLNRRPADSGLHDPATPLPLGALRGRVDFRSTVVDDPVARIPVFHQIPLAPAVVRGWLAPIGHGSRSHGPIFQWSGASYVQAGPGPQFPTLGHLWAYGTWRSNACFFHPVVAADYCGMDIVYHVGGPWGFDTRAVRNGRYEYCVAALTINDVRARRCTAVTITN